MANRMQDLRELLQGDAPAHGGRAHLLGGDLLGDLLGEIDGEMDGDLLGDLVGDVQQAARGQWKGRGGNALQHLNPAEIHQLRLLLARKRQQMMNVRNAPPLMNGVPGVPQTTQSRGFLPFFSLGGGQPFVVLGSGSNQSFTFQSQPQRPVRLHRLVAAVGYTPSVAGEANPTVGIITEIKVGQTSLFAGEGGIPLDMFAAQVMNSQFDGVSAGPGVAITVSGIAYGTIIATAALNITLGAYADQVI